MEKLLPEYYYIHPHILNPLLLRCCFCCLFRTSLLSTELSYHPWNVSAMIQGEPSYRSIWYILGFCCRNSINLVCHIVITFGHNKWILTWWGLFATNSLVLIGSWFHAACPIPPKFLLLSIKVKFAFLVPKYLFWKHPFLSAHGLTVI